MACNWERLARIRSQLNIVTINTVSVKRNSSLQRHVAPSSWEEDRGESCPHSNLALMLGLIKFVYLSKSLPSIVSLINQIDQPFCVLMQLILIHSSIKDFLYILYFKSLRNDGLSNNKLNDIDISQYIDINTVLLTNQQWHRRIFLLFTPIVNTL